MSVVELAGGTRGGVAVAAAMPWTEIPSVEGVPRPADPLPTDARPRRLAPGEAAFVEGDPAERVYEVVEGVVRLCRLLPDGRRAIVGFAWPGDLLGLDPGRRHRCTAEAVAASSLRSCPRTALEATAGRSAELRGRIADQVWRDLEAAQARLVQLGRMSALERVASFLLVLARRGRRAGHPAAARFDLPMGRLDLADHLGLTVETVSRAMTRLRRDGLIALPSPQAVVILRPTALAALAGRDDDDEAAEEGRDATLASHRAA